MYVYNVLQEAQLQFCFVLDSVAVSFNSLQELQWAVAQKPTTRQGQWEKETAQLSKKRQTEKGE